MGKDETGKIYRVVIGLFALYLIIATSIAIISRSIAVASDAVDALSAFGGTLFAYVAAIVAMRPATTKMTYGLKRAETAGELLNGLVILMLAIFTIGLGFYSLIYMHHENMPLGMMLIAGISGIAVAAGAYYLYYSGHHARPKSMGSKWQVIQSLIGSVNIIITVAVIKFTGFTYIDPIMGILFSFVLFYAAYDIIKSSLRIILELTPVGIDIEDVKKSLYEINGVSGIHQIHAFSLSKDRNIFSAHICVDDITMTEKILEEVVKVLKEKYRFYLSTIQIEKTCRHPETAIDIDIY